MSVYLRSFTLPDEIAEQKWLFDDDPAMKAKLRNVYTSFYPFKLFTKYAEPPTFEFDPITVIYGGNGSGKSTVLNLIAAKLELDRRSRFETTDFFSDYVKLCIAECDGVPRESKIITSDDVFKKLYDTRGFNTVVDGERKGAWDKKRAMKQEIRDDPSLLRLRGLDDFDRWNEYRNAVNQSTSQFIRDRAEKNIESRSNGETALKYLTDEIGENALYLLDEPENSLSPAFQLELRQFIEDSARFFKCQFVISTHSPLLLSANGAKIYNLDDEAEAYEWYELENVRVFAKFFAEHAEKFSDE